MSSYKPKSLDELNSMYDKALCAERAIKRGTSKINESSSNFFEDVIKEAELTVTKEPEKPIADLSVAVDDFIKHFSTDKPQEKEALKTPAFKPKAAPVVKSEEKPTPAFASSNTVSTPAISKKQSSEHISSLMNEYIKIMNDQDDGEEEEEKRFKKSFLSRKKEKKLALKEIQNEESNSENSLVFDENAQDKSEPLEQDEPLHDDETDEDMHIASEEAFNAFSAIGEKKETFSNEVRQEYAEKATEETAESEDYEETPSFPEYEKSNSDYEETESESLTVSNTSEKKNKNTLRVALRISLSVICVITVCLSLLCASLSTVFNINTGKEAIGESYYFTSSHNFTEAQINAGDLVVCQKQSTVSDGETTVYIDLENRTFSFGIKTSSEFGNDDDIIYIISGNEVNRDDVLGTVSKTVPKLGGVISKVYDYYALIIALLAIVSAVLLFVVIFVLKKKSGKAEQEKIQEEESESFFEESDEKEQEDIFDESENSFDEEDENDLFTSLD